LKTANFYYWCKRIRDGKATKLPDEMKGFIAVETRKVTAAKETSIPLELDLPNQARLRFRISENQLLS
jgi:hypothetical protein